MSFLTRLESQWPPHRASSSRALDSLDYIVVTHPFHPLSGQRLVVAFERRCPVHDRLLVCEAPARRVTLPIAWTDRALNDTLPHRLGVEALAALAELVAAIQDPLSITGDVA